MIHCAKFLRDGVHVFRQVRQVVVAPPEQLQVHQQLLHGRVAYARAVGSHGHMAAIIVAEKRGGVLVERRLGEAPVPRLMGFEQPKGFDFS